jgi:hypothetical protein
MGKMSGWNLAQLCVSVAVRGEGQAERSNATPPVG